MTFIHDQGNLCAAANLCLVQTIQLTCENPTYTFGATGLLDIFLGLINANIQHSTTTSTPGNLVLPYTDTPENAALLIKQFKLTTSFTSSYIFISRTVFGGSSEVKFRISSTSFNFIKLATRSSGIQFPDSYEVDLWSSNDNAFDGFYIVIEGIDFTPGSEMVRLTASQDGPVLQSVTCCRYSNTLTLDLPKFVQIVNPDFNLSSWSYFGTLTGNSGTYAFTFLVQKSFPIQVPFFHHKLDFAMAGGYNSLALGTFYQLTDGLAGGYQITACADAEGPSIALSPWSLTGLCQPQIGNLNTLNVKLTSGTYGAAGATYQLQVVGSSGTFIISVDVTDELGLVNEGMGPDSFLLNWITPTQRAAINSPPFSGNVEAYLTSGADDFECQGSYYFSQPLLRVNDFQIIDLSTFTIVDQQHPTNDSVIWFDSVTQSYDAEGIDLLKAASWDFFAIKFLDQPVGSQTALMITRVFTPGNSYYYLANLFRPAAAGPTLRWNMNDISIMGRVGSEWPSPKNPPGNSYYTIWDIVLSGPTGSVVLVVDSGNAPAWPEQEVCTTSSGSEVCKYEGLAVVTGTVLGVGMTGNAWIETAAL
jgi:hypothetical protein